MTIVVCWFSVFMSVPESTFSTLYWMESVTSWSGPNFMALLTAKFCACDPNCLLTGQAPSFRACCVGEECLVTLSTHTHKQKITANL